MGKIDSGSLAWQCFDYLKYQIENLTGKPCGISREVVTDVALRALKLLKIALATASFYYRPNTFFLCCAVGALVLPENLKELIAKVESLLGGDSGVAFGLGAIALFSVLPSGKWEFATIAYATYYGYKLFDASRTQSLREPQINIYKINPEDEYPKSIYARIKANAFVIVAVTSRILADYGARLLDISAFVFLFSLKPVVLPITFGLGAVLPYQGRLVTERVSLIWKYNKPRVVLLHLTIPLILPSYLWMAATLYGLHHGSSLYFDSLKKDQGHNFL